MNNKSLYLKAVTWFILSLVISITNDVFQKYLGDDLHFVQITFLRFFFSTLSLLPFMLYFGKQSFYTSRISLHLVRGALLFFAIALWVYGLTQAPITVATTLTFIIPMFVLILAGIFLKEKIGLSRWIATLFGFFGVYFVLQPSSADFTPMSLLLLLATLMFATLDIINKKYVVKESMLAMLFYTALVTMLLGAIPSFFVWKTPTLHQILLFAILGCGANLILYCLLKAFSYADASAVAPFRYIELVLSAALGAIVFGEIPSASLWIGSGIIIPATLFLVYIESKNSQTTNDEEVMPEPQATD